MEPIRNILGKLDRLLSIADELFWKQDIFGVDGQALTEGKFYKGEIVNHPIFGPGFVIEEAPEEFEASERTYLCKIKVGSDYSYGPDAKILIIYPGDGLEHTDRRIRRNRTTKEDLYPSSYPYA